MTTTTPLELVPDGPFSLATAATFGFGPNTGRPTYANAQMKLAFVTDDLRSHALVSLDQAADGVVTGTIESEADPSAVRAQVARILSLNGSGTAWLRVGEADPVLGALQREYPGLRPVSFHSPYEAAAWSIISARRQRAQGAVVRNRIAQALGWAYGDGRDQLLAFPTPERLLELRDIQSLDEVKVERLHAVARAALNGELDAGLLLGMSTEDAMAHLQRLPGIGPMYATLILLRSTGAIDSKTGVEPRLGPYLAHFYGLPDTATEQQVSRIMDGWRPFRTWSAVLIRVGGDRLGIPLPASSAFAGRRRR
jgi:DNA-3-methyladenine glycosylase II